MQEVSIWIAAVSALLVACGTSIGLITFWVNRGKVEGELEAKVASIATTSSVAAARSELLSQQLSEVRVEFARELQQYATHKDLAAAEMRFTQSMDNVRQELRGVNQRLDRLLDRVKGHDD